MILDLSWEGPPSSRAAVAQWVELVVQWSEGRWFPWGGTELHAEVSLSKILNPRIAPDVQLAPCGAATVISKGPAMSWRLIQAFAHE